MPALRVYQIKRTSANAIVVDLFALGGENESKYDQRSSKDAFMRFSKLL